MFCGEIPVLRCSWDKPEEGAVWVPPSAAIPLGSPGHVAFYHRTSDHSIVITAFLLCLFSDKDMGLKTVTHVLLGFSQQNTRASGLNSFPFLYLPPPASLPLLKIIGMLVKVSVIEFLNPGDFTSVDYWFFILYLCPAKRNFSCLQCVLHCRMCLFPFLYHCALSVTEEPTSHI